LHGAASRIARGDHPDRLRHCRASVAFTLMLRNDHDVVDPIIVGTDEEFGEPNYSLSGPALAKFRK